MISLNSKVFQNLKEDELNKLNVKVAIEEIMPNSLQPYKIIDNISTKDRSVNFSFYTKSKTSILITPEINQKNLPDSLKKKVPKLLFFPKFKQIKVEENCSENHENLKFEMRVGLIINGNITPPMKGVRISANNKENNEIVASTESLEDGSYKIGPLYTEMEYNINAIKEGYKIWTTQENPYTFKAEKLSFLRVKIVDTQGKPLSSVFISLSSSNREFKINSNTNNEGYYDFIELYSGEYYIKPMFKEYKFEPSQKMVNIVGGEHYEEVIVAHRVAFSIFGKSKSYIFLILLIFLLL